MSEKAQPIQFAGAVLDAQRHVCAFFHSPDEEYRVLLPFIKEGFERGEKAFHSGLELQLHLVTAHCPTPLIFITAHEDDETRRRALRAGATDFLYKPFSDEVLLSAVQAALVS